MKDLNTTELIQYEKILRDLRKGAENESRLIREKYITDEGIILAQMHKIPVDEARQRVKNRSKGRLSGDDILHFDDGTTAKIRDMLKNLSGFDGKTLADPIEPNYGGGRNKARFFANIGTGVPVIHSQAHGERTFRLIYDYADLKDMVENDASLSTEKLISLIAAGDLDEDSQEDLLKLWKEKRGGNLKKLHRKLDEVTSTCKKADDHANPSYNTPEYAFLNLKYGLSMMGNKAVIIEEKFSSDIDSYEFVAHRHTELSIFWANIRILSHTGKGYVNIFDAWLTSTLRNTFTDIEFRPDPSKSRTGTRIIQQGGTYNMWQGYTVSPVPGNCSLILDHIKEVWCNGDEEMFAYVLNWFADMFQHPYRQGKTAIVLSSGQGTGKNIILDNVIGHLFGGHALLATRKEDFLDRFNWALSMAVFVFVNEAVWAGNKEKQGALKALITDAYVTVEKKFLDSMKVRNCAHLIFASNESWVAPADIEDRRFVYPDVSNHRQGDSDYFKKLAEQIENGGRAAFLHEMLKRSLLGVDLTKLPQNQSQQRLTDQLRTAEVHIKFLYDLLQDPDFASYRGERVFLDAGLPPWEDREWIITKDIFFKMYQQFCQSIKSQHPVSKDILIRNISSAVPGLMTQAKVLRGKYRTPSLKFPAIDDARDIFTTKTKLTITWED